MVVDVVSTPLGRTRSKRNVRRSKPETLASAITRSQLLLTPARSRSQRSLRRRVMVATTKNVLELQLCVSLSYLSHLNAEQIDSSFFPVPTDLFSLFAFFAFPLPGSNRFVLPFAHINQTSLGPRTVFFRTSKLTTSGSSCLFHFYLTSSGEHSSVK